MWIVTIASLVGVVLNIHKRRECFFVWVVTNFLWMIYDFQIGAYEQSALFAVYFLMAVWGIFAWGGRNGSLEPGSREIAPTNPSKTGKPEREGKGMKYRIEIIKGKRQWYWRIVHRNGHILAHSETYSQKAKAVQTAKNLHRSFRPGFVLKEIQE